MITNLPFAIDNYSALRLANWKDVYVKSDGSVSNHTTLMAPSVNAIIVLLHKRNYAFLESKNTAHHKNERCVIVFGLTSLKILNL